MNKSSFIVTAAFLHSCFFEVYTKKDLKSTHLKLNQLVQVLLKVKICLKYILIKLNKTITPVLSQSHC